MKPKKGQKEKRRGHRKYGQGSSCTGAWQTGTYRSAWLTNASQHGSQVAVPLMQMASARAPYYNDLVDSAYEAGAIKEFSRQRRIPRRADKTWLMNAMSS